MRQYSSVVPVVIRPLVWFMVFLTVGAGVLGVNPFANETVTPFGVLVTQRAWAPIDPDVDVKTMARSDVMDFVIPAWTAAKSSLRQGHFPAWDAQRAGGTNLTLPTTSIYTPAFVIFAAIPDDALAFYLAVLLNLGIAGLGMYLFLRRRLCVAAALTGAVTFQLCGFHTAWLYWPHVLTSIWAPWLLLAVAYCAAKPSFGRVFPLAVASALVVLGGFPFVSLLILEAGGLYALVVFVAKWRSSRKSALLFGYWYGCGSALGALLCVLPVLGLYFWLNQFDIGYRHGGSIFSFDDATLLLPPWSYMCTRVKCTMYVGGFMALFAVLAVVITIVRFRAAKRLEVFGVLLLVFAAGMVFELFPLGLMRHLPGMGYNQWSRAISILDMALIILGACAMDQLWRLPAVHKRKLLRAAVALVLVVQVVEMGYYFRRFNGSVDADYYYPEVPSIAYMQEHAGPFDYVVADKSFLVSGTLGAYGLNEWFAHSFRTPGLKKLLTGLSGNPFTTRTASRLNAANIRFESPMMRSANVRFIAIDSRADPFAYVPAGVAHGKHQALPPLPGNRWIQHFDLDHAVRLSGISVRLATYRRTDLAGPVTLIVLDEDSEVQAKATIAAGRVADNAMQRFRFSPPVVLPPGQYGLVIRYRPTDPSMRLTAWSFRNPEVQHALYVNGHARAGTIDYALHTAGVGDGPFRKVLEAGGISVYENTAAPDGPYFLPVLTQTPNAASGRTVEVVNYRPGEFSLRYTGSTSGFVVVPMTMAEGWNVRVDDKVAMPEVKAGVFPAVPVDGPATLSFVFKPLVLRWRVMLLWLCGLILAVSVFAYVGRGLSRVGEQLD